MKSGGSGVACPSLPFSVYWGNLIRCFRRPVDYKDIEKKRTTRRWKHDGGLQRWSAFQLSLFFFLLLVSGCASQSAPEFRCSVEKKCQAMAGFAPQTETTYGAIKKPFQVASIYDLYGANGLNETTPTSTKVPVNATVKIPFPCSCANGTGVSDRKPVYNSKIGDSLKKIARETFGGLVTDRQIADANGIVNASSPVNAGKRLLIPLPCSCGDLNFSAVVHLAHVVREETSLAEISDKFSVFRDSLLSFNDVADSKSLVAGQILDVPLYACSSSNIRPTSPDVDLYVPNGSYALTAKNCIKCSCYSPRGELYCELSPDSVENDWGGCSRQTCVGEYPFSRLDTFGTYYFSKCCIQQCVYAGYDNRLILTSTTTLRYSECDDKSGSNPAAASAGRGLLLGWTLSFLLLLFR